MYFNFFHVEKEQIIKSAEKRKLEEEYELEEQERLEAERKAEEEREKSEEQEKQLSESNGMVDENEYLVGINNDQGYKKFCQLLDTNFS